jgi:hypothetical protein
VGFSPLLDTDTTVYTWVNKAFAMPTDQAAVLNWQPQPSAHGYSSGDFNVMLRQPRFFVYSFLCHAEKNMNAFHGNVLSLIHSV